jgi:predicted MFS family arabinose efflux permease
VSVVKTKRRGSLAVLSVALGTFTLVTNEFLPVGLLVDMHRELHVSEGVAGLSLTVPGCVAAIASPAITIGAGRMDRRRLLLIMTALFIGSDLLSASASTFGAMLAGRFLLGLGIGGFWAIGSTLGPRLVGDRDGARATATIFSGVAIASVIGVPTGALIGGLAGWRVAFLASGALGVIALVTQLILLPPLGIGIDQPVTWRQLSSVARGRNARAGLVTTLLLVIGQFAAYAYVGPFLAHKTGASSSLISLLLLVYGGAGIISNFAIGAALKSHLRLTVIGLIVAVMVSAAAMPVLGLWTPGAFVVLLIWGAAFGAMPIGLQTWIFTADNAQPEGGAALYISSFQISIATGSLLGGVIVNASGVQTAMAVGAGLAAVALGTFLRLTKPLPRSPIARGGEPPNRTPGVDRAKAAAIAEAAR